MCGYSIDKYMAFLDSKFEDIEKMRKVMSINEHHLRLRVTALENKVLQQSEQIKQLIEKLEGK